VVEYKYLFTREEVSPSRVQISSEKRNGLLAYLLVDDVVGVVCARISFVEDLSNHFLCINMN